MIVDVRRARRFVRDVQPPGEAGQSRDREEAVCAGQGDRSLTVAALIMHLRS